MKMLRWIGMVLLFCGCTACVIGGIHNTLVWHYDVRVTLAFAATAVIMAVLGFKVSPEGRESNEKNS